MSRTRLALSVGDMIDKLSIVNLRIAFLEKDLRDNEHSLSDAEAGRRAKVIRALNAERVALKNSLNAVLEPDAFPDIKVAHLSEDAK